MKDSEKAETMRRVASRLRSTCGKFHAAIEVLARMKPPAGRLTASDLRQFADEIRTLSNSNYGNIHTLTESMIHADSSDESAEDDG